jgi:small-conductance mechanosensitive channel
MIESWQEIFKYLNRFYFAGNTASEYVFAVLLFFTLVVLLHFFKLVVIARLRRLAKKTKTNVDDVVTKILYDVRSPFYILVSLYFSSKILALPQLLVSGIKILFIVSIVYEVVKGTQKLIDLVISRYLDRIQEDDNKQHNESMIQTLRLIGYSVLWLIGATMVLANLGINITSIIASLGIGGIAVALAVQNILGDIFSSFSIYIDKPFKVGDFIVVGQEKGVVEKIGLKTTRLRSLDGEELIISNKELTSVRVQNYKRMTRRRGAFNLNIAYENKKEKLEKIPKIIKEIIDKTDGIDFDRCNFREFGEFSLIFEVVFYTNTADYDAYMDVKQQVNLEIFRRFAKEKIAFAYPTQTLFVKKAKR